MLALCFTQTHTNINTDCYVSQQYQISSDVVNYAYIHVDPLKCMSILTKLKIFVMIKVIREKEEKNRVKKLLINF